MVALRADGTVVSDTLRFIRRSDQMRLIGRVHTASGGILDVRKILRAVRDPGEADPRVRTTLYRYQAMWRSTPEASIPLFRYDNYREDVNTLHRHDFDAGGNETDRYSVPHDQMPFMDEVIREAEELARMRAESA
ncbi:MAG: hypothetical protein F4X26_01875 [Chloroflexi bacterium]|nr:hypothetical protein [Chloroflexota bacterium]